jgi:hypothetical protein
MSVARLRTQRDVRVCVAATVFIDCKPTPVLPPCRRCAVQLLVSVRAESVMSVTLTYLTGQVRRCFDSQEISNYRQWSVMNRLCLRVKHTGKFSGTVVQARVEGTQTQRHNHPPPPTHPPTPTHTHTHTHTRPCQISRKLLLFCSVIGY